MDFPERDGKNVPLVPTKQVMTNNPPDVTDLLGSDSYYGNYQVLGNLTVTIAGISNVSNYYRELDLETGVHTTNFSTRNASFTNTVVCSYPDSVCIYTITSSSSLPAISFGLENPQVNTNLQNETCGDGYVRLTGYTQLGPPLGMKYDAIARLATNVTGAVCSNETSGILVVPAQGKKSIGIVVGAGTDYDQTKGNAASNYSFRGVDPGEYVEGVTAAAALKPIESLITDGESSLRIFERSLTIFKLSLIIKTSQAYLSFPYRTP